MGGDPRGPKLASLPELHAEGRAVEGIFAAGQAADAALAAFAARLAAWAGAPDVARRDLAPLAAKVFPGMPWPAFMAVMAPLERELGRSVTDADILIHGEDRPAAAQGALPFDVVLDNVRSAFNVGTIFRTADALGVRHVHLCGYTPTPEHPRVAVAGLGAEAFTPWTWHPHADDLVAALNAQGVTTAALETVADSQDVDAFTPTGPVALVLGNERHGLSPALVAACRARLRIPMRGRKNSLNVGVAFAVAGFALSRADWPASECF